MSVSGSAYKIYRLPGPAAERRRKKVARVYAIGYDPRPRRMKPDVIAESQRAALAEYVAQTYVETVHPQYREHRFEWRGMGRKWRADDGRGELRGRDWSVVVTLANGQNVHDLRLVAWR